MKRILFTTLCVFLLALSLNAQKEQTVFGQGGLRLTGTWGGFAIGNSFYGESYSFQRGGFFGFEFNNLIFLGWGWYRVEDSVRFRGLPPQDFRLNYNGFILNVTPMSKSVVHPKFSLLTGRGHITIQSEGQDRVFMIQPSAGFEVNVFRWSHVTFEGGYRFAANNHYFSLSDADLSSWFLQMTFSFGFSWGSW